MLNYPERGAERRESFHRAPGTMEAGHHSFLAIPYNARLPGELSKHLPQAEISKEKLLACATREKQEADHAVENKQITLLNIYFVKRGKERTGGWFKTMNHPPVIILEKSQVMAVPIPRRNRQNYLHPPRSSRQM